MRYGHAFVNLLAEAAGIDYGTCDPDVAKRVRDWASQCWDAHCVWSRPREIEDSLGEVLRGIRKLRKEIECLDTNALQIARAAHFRESAPTSIPEPEADPDADNTFEGTVMYEWFAARYPSKEDMVDVAALRHLANLERALVRSTEIAIGLVDNAAPGRGRPPELAARAVALTAARALFDLTGNTPTYRRDSTAYAKLTAAIFEFLGENWDSERACKWALTKLPISG